jgi:type I restriction enzyme R subunit
MIHKFDDMPANINPRANIFVLVDEAHRTTGGDLGNYLMGALPRVCYALLALSVVSLGYDTKSLPK